METTVISMDLHNKTQIMIAFYLNEYNRVAKTGKKLSHSGHPILAGMKCKCHISFIFTVTIHLLRAQLSDKRNKMKSKCRIFEISYSVELSIENVL